MSYDISVTEMIKNPFVPGLVAFGNLIAVTMLFVLISKPQCIQRALVGSFEFNHADESERPKNSLEAMVHLSHIMTDMS